MTLTFNSVMGLVWRTVTNPREGAAEVLALGVPRQALWTILALVVVLSILLAHATGLLMLAGGGMAMGPIVMGPLVTGVVQLALLLLMVAAIYWIGRAMGGTGSFDETLLLVSWLQFIMVCIQAVQTVALILLAPLATIIGFAALVLFLWLLTSFVAVLHGFRSLAQVFLMILASAFGIAFALSILLAALGFNDVMMGQL